MEIFCEKNSKREKHTFWNENGRENFSCFGAGHRK